MMIPASFFIFLNKPVGITSQTCLKQFKRIFSSEVRFNKVGHHGTLDPFAQGLLLVGVNEATKYFSFVDDRKKTYEATLHLGIKTDTLDHTGNEIETALVPSLDLNEIQILSQSLARKIQQQPPMYSAVKFKGKKLYELARQNIEVERAFREVEIHRLTALEWQSPFLKISTEVSRGTYIRVLAEQIAEKLGTKAHLISLTRTHLCGHGLESAFSLDSAEPMDKFMIPVEDMLKQYDFLSVDINQATQLFQGKSLIYSDSTRSDVASHSTIPTYFKACCGERFLGLVTVSGNVIKPVRMMQPFSLQSL